MPSTKLCKLRKVTYEELVDTFIYDPDIGRFRYRRTTPPRGKPGGLAGAWNPKKNTWQLSWQGRPFSMAAAVWLWYHKVLPPCDVLVTGDVTLGVHLENLELRQGRVARRREAITVHELRDFFQYTPGTGELIWLKSLSNRVAPGTVWKPDDRRVTFLGRSWAKTHLIWWYMTGTLPPKRSFIDHRDGNPKNNCWDNLRLVSGSQNSANTKDKGRRSLLPRGVYPVKGGFRAIVMYQRKRYYSDPVPTPTLAHQEYRRLHQELHGEFSIYASRN